MSDDVEKVSEVFAERDALRARLEATEAALRPLAKAYERLRGYDSLTYDLHENTSTESWPVYLTAQELAAALAALDKETQGTGWKNEGELGPDDPGEIPTEGRRL